MDRVAVVGPGGAGKSTFARQLGDRTGIPVVHLDHYFWQPGWVETPQELWPQRQAALLTGDRWIADGNYGKTFDVRFERADTVIVISPSRWACLAGALSRSIRNHGAEVQAEGCPERIRYSFYRWIWNYNRDSRPRLDAALGRHGHLQIFELTSRTGISKFLDSLTIAHRR